MSDHDGHDISILNLIKFSFKFLIVRPYKQHTVFLQFIVG